MSNAAIQAIRGMNDILPQDMPYWHKIEGIMRFIMAQYGYEEIRSPIVEQTHLFKRSIGDATDIVEKEMYTFLDRNGDSLSMRPEGTAQCVRAAIQHGLLYNQTPRLWYYGPMFRHERPQKGRYRQFYQLGVETFGSMDPIIDAEQVIMAARIWDMCGITKDVVLKINSLGTKETRQSYREVLIDYLDKNKSQLDEDSIRRLQTNPLRILDSKNPEMAELIQGAPKLLDHLDEDSKAYFTIFKSHLDEAGIAYEVEPTLVRGLDYYCHTVYEWETKALGAQGTVCAGGRYDGLVELIGGKPTPAVGFAIGAERLIALMAQNDGVTEPVVDAYLVLMGDKANEQGLKIAENIRNRVPDLKLLMNIGRGGAKGQFKRADKVGAKVALVVGDEELAQNKIAVKFLREDKPQVLIEIEYLNQVLNG